MSILSCTVYVRFSLAQAYSPSYHNEHCSMALSDLGGLEGDPTEFKTERWKNGIFSAGKNHYLVWLFKVCCNTSPTAEQHSVPLWVNWGHSHTLTVILISRHHQQRLGAKLKEISTLKYFSPVLLPHCVLFCFQVGEVRGEGGGGRREVE